MNYNQQNFGGYNPVTPSIQTYNVFVGDLLPQVDENHLKAAFSPCGPIQQVLIMRDKTKGTPKGYGFVHFKTKEAQQKALKPPFNNQHILGRPCRVNPSDDKNTLFVGNLASDMTEYDVRQDVEALVGPFMHLELKTGPPPTYVSRGFAFVTFNDRDSAENAKRILENKFIRGKQLNVKWADQGRDLDPEQMSKVKTLYISNLAPCVRYHQLNGFYSQFGSVKNCSLVKNRGFAFVEFEDRADCEQALKHSKNVELCGQPLNVDLAKPQSDQEMMGAPRGFNNFSPGIANPRGRGNLGRGNSRGGRGPRGGRQGGRSSGGRSSAPGFNFNGNGYDSSNRGGGQSYNPASYTPTAYSQGYPQGQQYTAGYTQSTYPTGYPSSNYQTSYTNSGQQGYTQGYSNPAYQQYPAYGAQGGYSQPGYE